VPNFVSVFKDAYWRKYNKAKWTVKGIGLAVLFISSLYLKRYQKRRKVHVIHNAAM
jgi:hypothetical protein